MDLDVIRRVRIPYDWALEVGMLSEVFRNCAPRAICQSELCENYEGPIHIVVTDLVMPEMSGPALAWVRVVSPPP